MRDIFRLEANRTTFRREATAGATTFMTMAYILCVQPPLLAGTGMDEGAVLTATCLSSALATLLMGLWARYPVALAPAMGHNFYVALTVCGAMGYSWQAALGANLAAGLLFLLVTVFDLQGRLVRAIPESLRHGIAVGIGLFIALIGLEWSGIIVDAPGTLVGLGDLGSRPVLVSLAVLAAMALLMAFRVRGAILLGILFGLALAIPLGVAELRGVVSAPPSPTTTFLALDLRPLWSDPDLWTVVFVLFFLDVFDTMGTLMGVATQGGLMEDGRLPRARRAFLSDAVGTIGGACLGTTTVTAYVESSAGIAAGGRTGLTAVTTAVLFLAALFFQPLIRTLGEGIALDGGAVLRPLTAPALVVIGTYMMRSATRIDWDDPVEAMPAFLTVLMIPLTVSISEGIAFGFLSCSLLRLATRRSSRREWLLHLFSAAFLAKYLLL